MDIMSLRPRWEKGYQIVTGTQFKKPASAMVLRVGAHCIMGNVLMLDRAVHVKR